MMHGGRAETGVPCGASAQNLEFHTERSLRKLDSFSLRRNRIQIIDKAIMEKLLHLERHEDFACNALILHTSRSMQSSLACHHADFGKRLQHKRLYFSTAASSMMNKAPPQHQAGPCTFHGPATATFHSSCLKALKSRTLAEVSFTSFLQNGRSRLLLIIIQYMIFKET